MHTSVISVIQDCHEASDSDRMNFPQILEKLHSVGIEGYSVDYRRSAKTYYQPDGESLDLSFAPLEVPVAATFDSERLQAAIREAQANAAGYTYRSFCRKVMLAGWLCWLYRVYSRPPSPLFRTDGRNPYRAFSRTGLTRGWPLPLRT